MTIVIISNVFGTDQHRDTLYKVVKITIHWLVCWWFKHSVDKQTRIYQSSLKLFCSRLLSYKQMQFHVIPEFILIITL